MKLRQCYVLREIKIDMKDLKVGDIFRLSKAVPIDCIDEHQFAMNGEL